MVDKQSPSSRRRKQPSLIGELSARKETRKPTKPRLYSDQHLLLRAAADGDLETVKSLYEENNEILKQCDFYGSTALHLAAYYNQLAVVHFLLSNEGVEVNSVDVFGRSILLHAARRGHSEVVDVLLNAGANPNLKDNMGQTPLMKACYRGKISCVKLLIKYGCDLEISDHNDCTALHHACLHAKAPMVHLLLLAGANPNARNLKGDSALHICTFLGHSDCLKELLNSPNIDLRLLNSNGKTALELSKSLEIKDLITAALNFKQTNHLKEKPIGEWSTIDVSNWIKLLGFIDYCLIFENHKIDGKSLYKMSAGSLEKIGIESYGDRLIIIDSIVAISNQQKLKSIEGSPQRSSICQLERRPSSPKISKLYDDFKLTGEILGKGYFGEVRKGILNGIEVAVKLLKGNRNCEKEIEMLIAVNHPNVVKYIGHQSCEEGIMILTEFLPGGTLENMVKKDFQKLQTTPTLRCRILTDIAKGMDYLHGQDPPILHRDLTPRNLLFASDESLKIVDFGLSRFADAQEFTAKVGLLSYMAPELYRGRQYGSAVDIFSFGIIIYFLLTGKDPHEGMSIRQYACDVALKGYRPKVGLIEGEEEQFLYDLMIRCWDSDPNNRPTFKHILQILDHR